MLSLVISVTYMHGEKVVQVGVQSLLQPPHTLCWHTVAFLRTAPRRPPTPFLPRDCLKYDRCVLQPLARLLYKGSEAAVAMSGQVLSGLHNRFQQVPLRNLHDMMSVCLPDAESRRTTPSAGAKSNPDELFGSFLKRALDII